METGKDSELLAGMNFYCFQHWVAEQTHSYSCMEYECFSNQNILINFRNAIDIV